MNLLRTTFCPACREELNPAGECLGCLLRVALDGDEETPPPAGEPSRFGDFQLARRPDGSLWELGRGGMGVTYRATDHVLSRDVALKVIELPPGLTDSPALRTRFLREARSTASLRHPNVAEVFQFGTSPETGQAYYAMQLIDGETLEKRVRREGPLPVETALEIAVQAAHALVAAAGQGLVHRDLKPANIMLSRAGLLAELRVTVIDFGLARVLAGTDNAARITDGGFVGTPAFASPEQFRGEPADARSDIYSLGVTLWYALTGRAPFTGRTVEELRDHPGRLALPMARLHARKVPAPIVALLRSSLAVDPVRRPASARALLTALEGCRPRPRRRRVFAIILVAGLLVLAGSFWSWRSKPLSAAVAVPDRSIAVLPFDNFSEDKDSAFFAEGVQDEVLADLSKVADLKVISRSSVMQYKDVKRRDLREIGRTLEVSHVLEGSVQHVGNRIRVTAQLIDARTDAHLWAEHYDRDLTDVFAIQSEIAQAVAGQLRVIISPREQAALDEVPTHDEQAYQLYLRALARANDPSLIFIEAENDQTIDLLRQATARDPSFARAFVLMAQVQSQTYIQTMAIPDGEKLRISAETVARLRPGSADASMAMGCYDYQVRRDYERAHEEFTEVVRQVPSDARANFYLGLVERRQGRWKEAVKHMRRAVELDPENSYYLDAQCDLLVGLRLYPESLTLLDRRLASHPAMLLPHARKATVLLDWKADTRAAREELALVPPEADLDGTVAEVLLICDWYDRDFTAPKRDLKKGLQNEIFKHHGLTAGEISFDRGDVKAAAAAYAAVRPLVEADLRIHLKDYSVLAILAKMDARLGNKEAALEEGRRMKALATPGDTLDTPCVACQWARVLVFAGEKEEAIRTLQTIRGQPYGPSYGDLRACPEWDALRGDPRFEAMVASLAPKP